MYCVYRHIRLDKNEPFYIGVAKYNNSKKKYDRAHSKCGRNKIWKGIVSRTKYEVEILFEDVTKEFASEKEKEFVDLYGRICNSSGTLSNLDAGGYYGYESSTAKTVSCYSFDGEYIESFTSLTNAVGKYGGSTGCLHDVLSGIKKSMSKLQWRYGDNKENVGKYKSHLDIVGKKVAKCDLNGNIIETYNTITEAAFSNNLISTNIGQCCSNKLFNKKDRKNPSRRITTGGFKWKFI